MRHVGRIPRSFVISILFIHPLFGLPERELFYLDSLRRRCPPAPGYRDFGRTGYGGVARLVGYFGFSWSSAFYDSGDYYRGTYLNFSTQYLYPNDANVRVCGFQLRCLSE